MTTARVIRLIECVALVALVGLAVMFGRGVSWSDLLHRSQKKTELMLAAEQGDLDRVRTLLKNGADPNTRNQKGQAALYFALGQYHRDIARELIEAGADINRADECGDTPLILAARTDDKALVQQLLDKGADPRASSGWGNAVSQAACWGNVVIVQMLADKGADVNHRGRDGLTPLMLAAQGGKSDCVEVLIEKGADVNARDNSQNTALIWAAKRRWSRCFPVLLDKKASVNAQDADGNTALMVAAWEYDAKGVEILVSAGADIDIENKAGETALVRAGQRGNVDLVGFLREKGAAKTNVFLNSSPYPTKALSRARAWGLATVALIVQNNGNSHELLGFQPLSKKEDVQEQFKKWWKISNRTNTLATLDWLLEEGHRREFLKTSREIAALSPDAFATLESKYAGRWNALANLEVLRNGGHALGDRSLLAWDLCRYIYVAGGCYVAGYLNEDEAWQKIMPVAQQIQRSYKSWEEMGKSYLLGRQLWNGQRDARFDYIFTLLCNQNDPNSPWTKNKWSADLSD